METQTYKVHIVDYPVYMTLGCFRQEQLAGQEVLVSLVARFNSAAADNDDLQLTVDYGQICQVVDQTLQYQKFNLVETCVQRVGQVLLQGFPQIDAIDVQIKKTIIPHGAGKGAQVSLSAQFTRE